MKQKKIFKVMRRKHKELYTQHCSHCNDVFYDKYTLLFHKAYIHNDTSHICFKCYGVFELIEAHKTKCTLPLNEPLDEEMIKHLILEKKTKKRKNAKIKIRKFNFVTKNMLGIKCLKNDDLNESEQKNKNENKEIPKQKAVSSHMDKLCVNKNKLNENAKKNNKSKKTNEIMNNKNIEKKEEIGTEERKKSSFSKPKKKASNPEGKGNSNIVSNKLVNNQFINKDKSIEKEVDSIKKLKEIQEIKIIPDKVENLNFVSTKNIKKNPNYFLNGLYINTIQTNKVFSFKNYLIFPNLKFGVGVYGQVNFSLNKKDFSPFAIKQINKSKMNENSVRREAGIIELLQKKENIFPKIYNLFQDETNYYIVQSLKGPDLKKYIEFANKIDLETAYQIGIELLINLKILHKSGILHIDIKEDNFLSLNTPQEKYGKLIHFSLSDFGFSVQFQNQEGIHYEPCSKLQRCGNFYYASINALEGNPVSRKDELISIVYIILVLCIGEPPWKYIGGNKQNEYRKNILNFKKKMDLKNLCENKYKEISEIYDDILSLNYKEEPKYDDYILKLSKKIEKKNLKNGKIKYFCWEEKIIEKIKKSSKNWKSNIIKDPEIRRLFTGFPSEYIVKYIELNYF